MSQKLTTDNLPVSEDQGTDSPKYVTVEQLNAAISSRFRSFESKQSETLAEIKALLSNQPQTQKEEKVESKKEDPAFSALKTQVEELRSYKAAARNQNLRNQVKQQFLAQGINPKAVDALIALHVDANKEINYASDSSDEILFKQGESTFGLADGVANWAKSDNAKAFLAPVPVKGSGDRGYNSNPNSTTKKNNTQEDFGNALLDVFLNKNQ